jgi:hypothetical protein
MQWTVVEVDASWKSVWVWSRKSVTTEQTKILDGIYMRCQVMVGKQVYMVACSKRIVLILQCMRIAQVYLG